MPRHTAIPALMQEGLQSEASHTLKPATLRNELMSQANKQKAKREEMHGVE